MKTNKKHLRILLFGLILLIGYTSQISAQALTKAEKMPSFPGGEAAMQKFITDNLKYPEDAQKAGTQGRITAQFIVTAEGQIENIRIIRGISSSCDAEVIRVIKAMPKWVPGEENGKVVAVYYALPIVYRLPAKAK
ncbi:MAG: energy transducer TonB [Dysgonomonas sp.]